MQSLFLTSVVTLNLKPRSAIPLLQRSLSAPSLHPSPLSLKNHSIQTKASGSHSGGYAIDDDKKKIGSASDASNSISIDPKTMTRGSLLFGTMYFLHYGRIVLKKFGLLNKISFSILLLASMLFAASFLFFLSQREKQSSSSIAADTAKCVATLKGISTLVEAVFDFQKEAEFIMPKRHCWIGFATFMCVLCMFCKPAPSPAPSPSPSPSPAPSPAPSPSPSPAPAPTPTPTPAPAPFPKEPENT
ncbi:unnamed protein product [Cuscuta epithymum]|uniref:Uncharacterized protein n=1 Tax=Cuscuta epithymum TaxID=186058 RepID=A0AAV0DNU5_9ASTE|nr:unnamed protein product [Cuscuta epithymum]CAH9139943.1 unnamed protein product [Cuscuta epithymum]